MRSDELLRKGVEQGIINDTQRAALAALDTEGTTGREAARGFNAITVAYGVGALIVLFAFGWFLVDRWKVLGDGGLLGVSLLYAALFLVAARVLAREGFPTARGVAVLLAVGMTPLAMRALGRWVGIWPADLLGTCGGAYTPFFPCEAEPLTIELTAAVAALVALRRVPFSPLVVPAVVAGLLIPSHLVQAFADFEWGSAATGWTALLSASLVLVVAYVLDQRRKGQEYAVWLHLGAAVTGLIACLQLFDAYRDLRHVTGVVALLAFAGAVYLRRRVYLALGAVLAFAYLAWLAAEVFRVTLAFPLVLAVLGLGIIIAAVWIQRRFPAIVARAGGAEQTPRRFPGGVAALLAPALLAVVM
ncbi:MAG TPA: hypothetical protein VIH11_03455, partial [Gemmatimonadaceae bacterium]